MTTLAIAADERVRNVRFEADSIIVELIDGRSIGAPLAWFPRLSAANSEQLAQWETCAGGFGIHWEALDEDLSTEGLLRGAPAPRPGVR
jgi:hypothetical protein